MNDQNCMEGILQLEKGACDLYLHGTLESCSDTVHQAFSKALFESLSLQNTIYDKMSEKGWYPVASVEQQKIDAVRQKFCQQ